ncbi:MAG: carboxypeptidase-like regulatory domain-containing protein, partial [Bacteroidales bacterium]|nr:carboxypeptidase-like regulatory domain-containing protein [Bacteroidales bacterium]
MYRITLVLLFISFFFSHQALGDDIFFSGEYQDIPFDRFIRDVERKKGVHFFYRQEWISGITITAKGDHLSLTSVLQQNLAETGLNFYIDNKRNVFLTPVDLVTILTEDPGYEQHNGDNGSRGDKGTINIRQKYFKGQKTRIVETIIIGTKEKNISRNQAIINGKIWNKENGESLIGATIYIEELKTGSVTDIDGRFSLVLNPGKYNAVFNCMGMKEAGYFLEVHSDGQLNISMEKKIFPINEVVVKADRFHNVRGMQMGFERLNMKSIKEIPLV